MSVIRHLAGGALLLASTAFPHSMPPGFWVESHLVASAGRTYVEAAVYAETPHDLWIALSNNSGWPATIDLRYCEHATACHYRHDVSGQSEEGKPLCPGATLDVSATHKTWWGMWRSVDMDDSFSIC